MICDVAEYRAITQDMNSFDGDVQRALEVAQQRFEQETFRHFERGEYTEKARIHGNGQIYPRTTPVVSTGSWHIPNGMYFVNGYAEAEITYVGGFTAEEMPQDVKIAVAETAKNSLREAESSIPVGATRVRVGDVSFSGSTLGDNTDLPDSVKATIRKWRV